MARLPAFLETLEAHDLDPKRFMRALSEYADLATELVLEQEPQLAPYDFLALSDARDVVTNFHGLFVQQSPHLVFEDADEEEYDDDFD